MALNESSDAQSRLLLVVDVAGALHCYGYVVHAGSSLDGDADGSNFSDGDDEPVALLTHLWSRGAVGQESGSADQEGEEQKADTGAPPTAASPTTTDAQASASPAADAGLGGFQCTLSKQLRRLQANTILPALRAAAATTPAASPTSATPSQTDAVPLAAPAPGAGSTSSATTRAGARRGAAALCPFCVSSAESAPPLASSRGRKPGRASSPSSPGLSGVSRAASSQSPSPGSATASSTSGMLRDGSGADAGSARVRSDTTTATATTTGAVAEEPLLLPGDFMARVPNVPALQPATASAASACAASLDEGPVAAGGAPSYVPAVQVGGPSSEVGWYWRCPRSVMDASEAAAAAPAPSTISAASTDALLTAAHVWVPLGEAVRHWNALCCRHHRLLLLRHMEEQYTEIDLFTGQPQRSAELTAAVVAAAAAAPLDRTLSGASSSARSRSWSSASAAGTSDRGGGSSAAGSYGDDVAEEGSAAVSLASEAAPRAVLSLTAQRFQTLLMQASSARVASGSAKATRRKPQSSGEKAGVSRPGSSRRHPASPTPPRAAHKCLAKFAAPAFQLSLTWYSGTAGDASPSLTMTSADDTSDDADEEGRRRLRGGEAITRDAAGTPPRHATSATATRSRSSSTSASDIDMDVLAGRKRLPVQYRFARPASSRSSSRASVTAAGLRRGRPSQRGGSAKPLDARAEVDTRTSTVPRRSPNAPAFDDIPLRCGPDGCVYGVSADFTGCGTASAGGTDSEGDGGHCERSKGSSRCSTHTAPPPLLLLQLPVPLLEAFWIVLPSPVKGSAGQRRDAASCPLEMRRVPWLPRDARTLRAVESTGPVCCGTGGAAAAPPPGRLPALTFAGGLSMVRGFLLRIGTTTPETAALSAQSPQVLRPLSAYDVLGSRVLCERRRGARRSGSGGRGARRQGKRSPTTPSGSAERDQPLGSAAAAAAKAETHRLPHTNSSASSFLGGSGSSVTHRISPPPHRFVPASSFFDENFEPLALLGRGVGGAALLARHRVTGVLYAVKVLIARDYESERDVLQEMRVHAMLDNRHVVRYHACWSEVISATRAQQLAFIGVCHAYEANVPPGRGRIDSSASSPVSPSPAGALRRHGQWRSRKASAKELTEAGKGLRSAPGGWHHLMLPSHSSMVLIGSDSTSESATPKVTQRGLARPQLRGNLWSTALVDECASETATESDNGTGEGGGAADVDAVSTAPPSAPRAPSAGGTTRVPMPPGSGRAGSPSSTSSSSSSASLEHRKGSAWLSAGVDEDELAAAGVGGGGGRHDVASRWGAALWNSDADADSDDGASTSSEGEGTSPRPRRAESARGDRRSSTVIGSRVVFLQMELCQVTLAQYLASRKAIDRVENLVILLQIIAGLRYLHQRGILHRDLKPTNVFMDYRCQCDDAAHHARSSSSSSCSSKSGSSERSGSSSDESSDADVEARHDSLASPAACGLGAQAGALTLCRHNPGACPPPHHCASPGTLAGAAAAAAAQPHHLQPVVATAGALAGASLDNLPTWDGERAALDLVLHAAHRTAAEMLEQRLQRRPPPPRVLASWASPPAATTAQNGKTANSPTQTRAGRRFLRRLAGWLRHRLVQVRLGDFGLAKFIYQQDLGLDGFVSMNASNTVGVGSPLYASPEQLKGSRCTAASDTFSLGVVLAEMYLQPTTIAERLTVLREVRDGVYHDGVLLARYPELKLVRRLTMAQPERRMTLKAVHRALTTHLAAALRAEVRDQYE